MFLNDCTGFGVYFQTNPIFKAKAASYNTKVPVESIYTNGPKGLAPQEMQTTQFQFFF
ncbi:MAG: hypothetical protein AABX38_06295 [Candidatus Micrarchaeota archaeon]